MTDDIGCREMPSYNKDVIDSGNEGRGDINDDKKEEEDKVDDTDEDGIPCTRRPSLFPYKWVQVALILGFVMRCQYSKSLPCSPSTEVTIFAKSNNRESSACHLLCR